MCQGPRIYHLWCLATFPLGRLDVVPTGGESSMLGVVDCDLPFLATILLPYLIKECDTKDTKNKVQYLDYIRILQMYIGKTTYPTDGN